MKKRILQILFVLVCTIVASCSDDDGDLQSTGINGKPGKITIK